MGVVSPSRGAWRLVCLLPIAATGCHSVTTPDKSAWSQPTLSAPTPPSPTAVQPSAMPMPMPAPPTQAQARNDRQSPKPDSSNTAQKTDFHKNVTTAQQFNVHMELGRAMEGQGQYETAVGEYQKALDACDHHTGLLAHPTSPAQIALAHRRMAGALDHLGRFTLAENHYRDAVKFAPTDAKVWNDAGYSYYLRGKWDNAERCLRHAAKLDPNDPRIRTNLGLALAAGHKTDAALESLSQSGGEAVGHANIGYVLAALGNTDEAREHYRKALELQPELAVVHQALAQIDQSPAPTLSPRLDAAREHDPALLRTSSPNLDVNSPTNLPPN